MAIREIDLHTATLDTAPRRETTDRTQNQLRLIKDPYQQIQDPRTMDEAQLKQFASEHPAAFLGLGHLRYIRELAIVIYDLETKNTTGGRISRLMNMDTWRFANPIDVDH